jgi:hypothetical protein
MPQRKTSLVPVGLLLLAMLALFRQPAFAQEPTVLYASTMEALSNDVVGVNAPITGLTLTLPAVTPGSQFAVVTLNLPNLYLSGGTPGLTLRGVVALSQDNANFSRIAQVGGDVVAGSAGAANDGRKPVSLVVKIPLTPFPITITAYFAPFSGSTVIHTDTFASLSAMLVAK